MLRYGSLAPFSAISFENPKLRTSNWVHVQGFSWSYPIRGVWEMVLIAEDGSWRQLPCSTTNPLHATLYNPPHEAVNVALQKSWSSSNSL